MKRSTALAMLGLFVLAMGALCSTAEGRGWLKDVASAQVDDVLDTVAVTPEQRRALDDMKKYLAAEIDAKIEQLQGLVRCVVQARTRPTGAFRLELPRIGPLSEVRVAPRLIRSLAKPCPGSGYLPPPRGAVAAEWRSCCSVAPR